MPLPDDEHSSVAPLVGTENLSENQPANSAPIITDNPPAPENEFSGEAEAPSKAGLLARIRATGARIIQGRGVAFKKGRGRPRNDGQPSPTDTIVGTDAGLDASEVQTSIDGSPVTDKAVASLCRRSIVAAVKAGQWFAKEVIRIKADAAGIDSGFVETALAKCEPEKGALEDFQVSLDAVLRKHNFRPKNDEEWALVIDAGRLFAPYALLLATFNAEIKRRRGEAVAHTFPPEKKEEGKP